jgi:hypothetical protein
MWGTLFDEKSGLYVFRFCWASPAQPFLDLSPTGLMSIVYCLYFWDSPNLEAQVPVFISRRNRLAQLYPRGIGSRKQCALTVDINRLLLLKDI